MDKIMHAAAVLLLVAATGASAQAVYRCANSYGEHECPGGQRVNAQDRRTAAQAAQTAAAAQRDARLADTLEARRKEEERGATTKPVVIGSAKPQGAASTGKTLKPVEFKAIAPRPAGAKPAKTKAKKKKPSA